MSAVIFVEGGGDTSKGRIECRRGFRTLLNKSGFTGRMPQIRARGGRDSVYDSFETAHTKASASDYVAMLIDSEDPVANTDEPWRHLNQRDGWQRPAAAQDDQVLLMVTCMETWIVTDRQTLNHHFGNRLQTSALPPLDNLESRSRQDVQDRLERATRDCPGPYTKGPKSFEVLGNLNPDVLEQLLPSFSRTRQILSDKLN